MGRAKEWLISVLERHRGLIVLFICLPASFVFDIVLRVYFCINRLYDKRNHNDKVKEVQSAVRRWNNLPASERKLLCTARPNWLSLSTTFFQKDRCHKIALPLYNILSLDEEHLSVKVEPQVKVGDITKYLLSKGYVMAVHLEIAEATLGGLAMGVGMTTHSHKVGLFQESILSYDLVLSSGSLVHVTKDNQFSDLFKALPWSHGTLGFVVALELKIIPAKPFIHLHYIPVRGQKQYCSLIYELSGASDSAKNTPDFLEATIYSKHEAVILAGWFSNGSDSVEVNPINRWYKPWFYKHVETFLKKGEREELIPLEDYLLRHNRSIFWVMESMLPFGNHSAFRFLFGWLLPPKIAFLKYTTTPGASDSATNTPDFLEATIYSKHEAVILAGWFSNGSDNLEVNPINRWYKPWFYKHVETFLKKGEREELIPLEDYLLRHNRSIFWVMESMLPFGNHSAFRFLFGWLLPPKIAFLKYTTTPGIRKLTFTKQVFQDIVLPLAKLEQQIDLSEELFDLYPLLVYPCRVYDWGPRSGQIPRPPSHTLCPGTNYAIYNDLGIYGVPGHVKRKSKYNPIEAMRKMEAFTRSVGGFSFLYADIFMTQEEFKQMFDLQLYEDIRKKYSADFAFPHLYEKVKPEIDVLSIDYGQEIQ